MLKHFIFDSTFVFINLLIAKIEKYNT